MGNPEENWFPWLRQELEKRGFEVDVPQFPINENQTLEGWERSFLEYYKKLDENSIIIGHSLGVIYALHVLQNKKRKIKGAFLVAGFISSLHQGEKSFEDSFIEKELKFNEIKNKSQHFFVYGSDNDPYVSLEKINELAEKLEIEPIIVEGAGHFNTKFGYTKFEDLLIDILSLEN